LIKKLPESLITSLTQFPGSNWTWVQVKDEIEKKLDPNCFLTDDFSLVCRADSSFPMIDILKLFETLRTQMLVVEDLIKKKYESMSFLRKAGKGLERTRVEV